MVVYEYDLCQIKRIIIDRSYSTFCQRLFSDEDDDDAAVDFR